MLDSVPDFDSLFDKKTSQELEAILSDYLSGNNTSASDDSAGVEKYNTGGDAVLKLCNDFRVNRQIQEMYTREGTGSSGAFILHFK